MSSHDMPLDTPPAPPERLMVRKLYYLMCDLLDHVESDPEFRPANRDDYRQDIDSARKLIREVRENGWNR